MFCLQRKLEYIAQNTAGFPGFFEKNHFQRMDVYPGKGKPGEILKRYLEQISLSIKPSNCFTLLYFMLPLVIYTPVKAPVNYLCLKCGL